MAHPIFFKRQLVFMFACLAFGSVFWYMALYGDSAETENERNKATGPLLWKYSEEPRVVLAVVACGDRVEEAMTMLKSAVIFSRDVSLHVVAIVDEPTRQNFTDSIELLLKEAFKANNSFTYEIKSTWFPSKNQDIWKMLYAPCSAQRIFLPSMLPQVDGLLYVDTDILFVSSLKDIWSHFSLMDGNQWVGIANEDEPPGDGWYNTRAKIPYFKPRGLNTGVLLLNLTRMRFYEAEQKAEKVLRLYGDKLYWGDQDIFNVMFSWNPEFVYKLPCEYNFRESHCTCRYNGSCSCESAAAEGVRVIHGNLKAFYKDTFFQAIYTAFKQHSLSEEKLSDLREELEKQYDLNWKSSNNKCAGSAPQFFKQLISLSKG